MTQEEKIRLLNYLPFFITLFFLLRLIYYQYLQKQYLIKKYNKKLEQAKTKIAYQMHQDIGNDINALLFKIRNLHLKNGNPDNIAYMQLEANTTQIIKKVNDIVWSLKSDNNSLAGLIDYLKLYTEETMKNKNIEHHFITTSKLPNITLGHDHKKNIYLFFKEAINNILKHAQANIVNIEIAYHKKKLSLSIADNGRGFKINETIKGNGIDNMTSRIKQLNGKVEFMANKPSGTIIKFEIKL
jgi:signal transduction histidine kinase